VPTEGTLPMEGGGTGKYIKLFGKVMDATTLTAGEAAAYL
jgi:hypothetical protein